MSTAAPVINPADRRPQAMIKNAYGAKPSLSRRFRSKRFEKLIPIIDAIIAKKGQCRIADIGGTKYYWDIAGDFVDTRPVEIHLINREPGAPVSGKFINVEGDATNLAMLDDLSFDLVHSNSVIEHVGEWQAMRAMAAEMHRLAPAYYVQTPNFWFPYEPHFRCAFFHWLPAQIRYRLVMRFALGFSDRKASLDEAIQRVHSARLIDQRQMRDLFPDAEQSTERVLGLAKSLIAIRR